MAESIAEVEGPADIVKLTEHIRRAISGWHWDRENRFVLKFADKQRAQDMLAKYFGIYQQDRTNDTDSTKDLLKSTFWKYVISMHIGTGVSVAVAIMDAKNNPAEVEAWAGREGLLKSGEIVQ